MKKDVLVVTLNPAIDHMVLGKRELYSAGGKGMNVSRALRTFGVPTINLSILAKTNQEQYLNLVRKEGLTLRFISVDGAIRVNVTRRDRRGRIRRSVAEGPVVSAADQKRLIKLYTRLITGMKMVVLAGRNAKSASDSLYERLIEIAKKKRVITVLDCSQKAFSNALRAKPWLIKPNQSEAQAACGFRIDALKDQVRAIKWFHRKGIQSVIISLGAKGLIASDCKEIVQIRVPKVSVNNDVGCGDVLLAGFLHKYRRGNTFKEALACAAALATASTQNFQPGLVQQRNLSKIISDIQIKILKSYQKGRYENCTPTDL